LLDNSHFDFRRHNDLPWNVRKFVHNQLGEVNLSSDLGRVDPWARSDWSHTDIPRLRAGLVGAQVNPTWHSLSFPTFSLPRSLLLSRSSSEEIYPYYRYIFTFTYYNIYSHNFYIDLYYRLWNKHSKKAILLKNDLNLEEHQSNINFPHWQLGENRTKIICFLLPLTQIKVSFLWNIGKSFDLNRLWFIHVYVCVKKINGVWCTEISTEPKLFDAASLCSWLL